MAESTLSIAYAELQAAVGRYLGQGDPATYGDSDEYGTPAWIVDQAIRAGTRKFLFPPPLPTQMVAHSWGFLKPTTTLTTSAPYSTGTIAIVDGVVTLTGGTWPTWAASGVLTVSNRSYSVNVRNSGSGLTLDDLTVDVDAGTEYVLDQRDYDLPDAFGFLEGDLTYEPNQSGLGVRIIGEGEIRKLRERLGTQTGQPSLAAVRPKTKAASASAGQRYEIMFYPAPSSAWTLSYRMQALPDRMTASDVFTWGGMAHAETLKQACLSAAEVHENDQSGLHFNEFLKELAKSIAYDLRTRPHFLGYNGDRSDDLHEAYGRHRSENVVSYTDPDGVSYP